jgi:hypothetical protein
MNKYKSISYKVIRNSLGSINAVVVFYKGDYTFRSIKQAKEFINNL